MVDVVVEEVVEWDPESEVGLAVGNTGTATMPE